MCPEQLRQSLGWIRYFSLLAENEKKKSYTKKNSTPGMQLVSLTGASAKQRGSALLVHVAVSSHQTGPGTPETGTAAPGMAAGLW